MSYVPDLARDEAGTPVTSWGPLNGVALLELVYL